MSDLSETIKAKSDQLNADDLVCGPVTVKLLDIDVDKSNAQQPWKMTIDGGHMPYLPCLSMRRVFIQAWGDDGTQGKSWIGRRMRLFRDPEVKFAGLKCGGIRISHLSDLPQEEMGFVVTIRKGTKGAYMVKRLPDDAQTTKKQSPTESIKRPDSEAINAVKEMWKLAQKRLGEPASAELWKTFCFGQTEGRVSEPLKSESWTMDDLRLVNEAIENLTAS